MLNFSSTSRITQKLLEGFLQNWVERWRIGQGRSHSSVYTSSFCPPCLVGGKLEPIPAVSEVHPGESARSSWVTSASCWRLVYYDIINTDDASTSSNRKMCLYLVSKDQLCWKSHFSITTCASRHGLTAQVFYMWNRELFMMTFISIVQSELTILMHWLVGNLVQEALSLLLILCARTQDSAVNSWLFW